MASSTLHLLAVYSLIIWSSTFALHIEPSETFVNDLARSITRPPNATGHIIPKHHQDSELKDVERLPNDTGHILPKDQQDSEEGLMNARNTPCDTTFTLSDGDTQTITSKNYPRKYPNNHKCTWEIETDSPATALIFNCTKFKVRRSWSCKKDYLQLQDGDQINTKFCGKTAPRSVISNTGSLTVSFKTDRKKKAKGFKCTVTAVGTTTSTTTTTSSSTTTTPTSTTTTTSSSTATTPTSTTTTTTTTTVPTGECQCTCGKVNRGSRIVGGQQTEVNEYPWQVGMIGGSSAPYCGASIIADQWVLTAAHCVDGTSPGDIRLVVGEHDHTETGETNATKQLTITQVIVHPSYNDITVDNDIALLKLSEPLEFMSDNKVAPVCLPDATTNYDNVNATVTGWGTLTQGGFQPNQLYEVTVPTMTNAMCDTQYSNADITDNMICAGLVIDGGKDSCQGDSGGPMVTQGSTNNMVQIGIVSWGYGCARPGFPGVYTRVTKYLDWIDSNTADSQTCPPATS